MRQKNTKITQSIRFLAAFTLSLIFCVISATSAQAATSTFTVSNANDDTNPGSLRWAITQCNLVSASDDCIISLANAGGTATVTLTTGLPQINRKAIFQNEDTSVADLLLDGATGDSSVSSYCLSFGSTADNSVLEGLVFKDCMDTVGTGSGAIDIALNADNITIGSSSAEGEKITIYGGVSGIGTTAANTTIQHTVIGRNVAGTVDGTSNKGLIVASTANGLIMTNTIIDSSASPNMSIGAATGITISSSQILNSSSHGLELVSTSTLTIDDSAISNNACGIRMSGGTSHIYRSNTITVGSGQRGFCVSGSPSAIRIGASNGAGIAADGNTFVGTDTNIDMQDATPSNFLASFNTFGNTTTSYVTYDSGFEPFAIPSSLVATTTSVTGTSGASSGTVVVYQDGLYMGSKTLSSTSFSLTVAGGDLTGELTSGSRVVVFVSNSSPIPTKTGTVKIFNGTISTPTVNPTSSQVAFSFTSTETLTPKIYIATSEGGLAGASANNGTLGTSHSKTITSLSASTIYYYRIDTVNSDGSITRSGVQTGTFTTSAPPDTTAPVLQSFTTSATNGRYGPGATITITATYNETINASSTMQIALNNGGSVTLNGVTSTATLTGTYTVPSTGAGGGTSDLTVSTITTESVTDLAASPNTRTNSTVPSGANNIGGAKDIVVDTTAPTVSEVTPVTTPTNDTTPNYVFTTNEAGTIAFTQGSCRSATTSASSGSNTITLDSDGAGGALPDGSYTNCRLTVTDSVDFGSANVSSALSISSFTIATAAPVFRQFVTTNAGGTYTTGESLTLGVQFASALHSSSTMTVRLTNGVELVLGYNIAYGGQILAGSYTVGAPGNNEDDTDLQVAEIVSMSISDSLGNSNTTPPSIVGATQFIYALDGRGAVTFVIDTGEAPTVSSISSDTANGAYNEGDVIDIDVTFSEPVTSTGSVTVTLETGSVDRTCTFTISTARTGTCNYTVQAGDTTTDLDATLSGTIADSTTESLVDFTPTTTLAAAKAIVIDTTAPSAATDFTAVSSGSSAQLAWTNPVSDFSSVTIRRSTSAYPSSITDGSAVTSGSSSTSYTDNALSDGTYYYSLFAIDAAGNASSAAQGTVTIDGTAPGIAITAPALTGTAAITSTTIRVTDARAVLAAAVSVSGSTTAGTSNFSCTQTSSTQVDCVITITSSGNLVITATDVAGNNTSQTQAGFSITAPSVGGGDTPATDTTPPGVDIVSTNSGIKTLVTENAVVPSKNPTFKGASEAGATVTVSENGATLCTTTVGSNGTWECQSTTSLALGSRSVSVVATDAAGNQSAKTFSFTRSSVVAAYTIKQTLIAPKAKKGKYPSVAKGKTVKYTVKIKNTGEANLTKLQLTQTYPKATLAFKKGTVKPSSTKKKGTVVWSDVLKNKPLKPGATRTITVTYVVKGIPAKKSARTLTVATKATGGKDVYDLSARNRTTKNKKLKVRFSIQDARFQSFIRFGSGRSSAEYSPKVQSVSLARGQTLLKFEDGTDNDFNDFQLKVSYKTASAQFEFIPVSSSANLDHTLYFRFVVNGQATDIPIFRSTKQVAQVAQPSAVTRSIVSYLE